MPAPASWEINKKKICIQFAHHLDDPKFSDALNSTFSAYIDDIGRLYTSPIDCPSLRSTAQLLEILHDIISKELIGADASKTRDPLLTIPPIIKNTILMIKNNEGEISDFSSDNLGRCILSDSKKVTILVDMNHVNYNYTFCALDVLNWDNFLADAPSLDLTMKRAVVPKDQKRLCQTSYDMDGTAPSYQECIVCSGTHTFDRCPVLLNLEFLQGHYISYCQHFHKECMAIDVMIDDSEAPSSDHRQCIVCSTGPTIDQCPVLVNHEFLKSHYIRYRQQIKKERAAIDKLTHTAQPSFGNVGSSKHQGHLRMHTISQIPIITISQDFGEYPQEIPLDFHPGRI